MKVLLINSSPHEHGHNYTAAEAVVERLQAHGIGSEIYWLGQGEVHACLAAVFDGRVPALLHALRTVDVGKGEAILPEERLEVVDFMSPVEEVVAPVVAPHDVGESRFGKCLERHGGVASRSREV